jgi:hypothetical protein
MPYSSLAESPAGEAIMTPMTAEQLIQPWKNSESYPHGRTAEFAMAASRLGVSDADILEYVTESQHQEGDSLWDFFSSLGSALSDLSLYLETRLSNELPEDGTR